MLRARPVARNGEPQRWPTYPAGGSRHDARAAVHLLLPFCRALPVTAEAFLIRTSSMYEYIACSLSVPQSSG